MGEAVPAVLGKILATCRIFLLFFFVPPPTRAAACPAECGSFSSQGGGGGGGDRDVDGEGERRVCRFSFSFCFHNPLCGAGPSLYEVVAACALSLLLSD